MTRNTLSPSPSSSARRCRSSLIRHAAVLAAASLLTMAVPPVSTALAQGGEVKKGEPARPPTAPLGNNTSAPFLPMGIGILVAILVVGVSFIPSRRGHQD